jgi:hypothetical protein
MDLKVAFVAGAVGALTGCAGTSEGSALANPDQPRVQPGATLTEAPGSVDANLARLRDLEVFGVGELLVKLPEDSGNCYGPCRVPEAVVAKAKQDAAMRLDKLADLAESAVKTPVPESCADATIDQNLSALAALQIVDVKGLIQEEPKASVNCYGQPCPQDVAAAKATKCERAGKLASIVKATNGL